MKRTILVLLLVFFKCSDILDPEAPEIEIISPKPGQDCFLTTEVEARISDNSTVNNVKLYLDEDVVYETSSNYIKTTVNLTKTKKDNRRIIKIKAEDKRGNWRESIVSFFARGAPPNQLMLIWPYNELATNMRRITFEWLKMDNVWQYQLQIFKKDTTSQPIFDRKIYQSNVEGDTVSQSASLGDDGEFCWRVRAKYNLGDWGDWTDLRWLTLDTYPPGNTKFQSPTNNSHVTRKQFSLTWSNAFDATKYHLHVSRNESFSDTIVNLDFLTGTNYQPTSTIPFGDLYCRIRAGDIAGNWGDWSDILRVKITPTLYDNIAIVACQIGGIYLVDIDNMLISGASLKDEIGGVFDVEITPNGQQIIVSNFYDKKIYVISLSSLEIISTFYLNYDYFNPEDIVIDSNGRYVFVTDGGGSTKIVVLDILLNKIASTFTSASQAIDIGNNGRNVLIVDASSYYDSVDLLSFDQNSGNLSGPDTTVRLTGNLLNVTISPDGRSAIVNGWQGTHALRITSDDSLISSGPIPNVYSTQSTIFNQSNSFAYSYELSTSYLIELKINGPGEIMPSGRSIELPLEYESRAFFGVDVLALSKNERYILTCYPNSSAYTNNKIVVIDINNWSIVKEFNVDRPAGIITR